MQSLQHRQFAVILSLAFVASVAVVPGAAGNPCAPALPPSAPPAPQDPAAHAATLLVRADCLLAAGDAAAAHDVLNEILTLQQDPALALRHDFHFQYGRLALRAGLIERAIASFNDYLILTGTGGQFYSSAVELLSSAEATLRRVLDIRPLRDDNRLIFGGGRWLVPEETQPLSFEAQIAGDVPLWSRQTVVDRRPGSYRWGFQSYASVMLRLRMLDDTVPSAPIPPPSFMPKITAQFVGFARQSPTRAIMNIITLVPYGHHSNGQAGCPLTDQTRVGKSCYPTWDSYGPHARPPINIDTGSFSTNYIEAGLHRRHIWFNQDGTALAELTFGGSGEWHLAHPFAGGDLGPEFWDRYGRKRFNYRFEATLYYIEGLERLMLRHYGQAIFGLEEYQETSAIEIAAYFDKRPDLALYFRFYSGQDYYNINFETRIFKSEIGVAFNWRSLLKPAQSH